MSKQKTIDIKSLSQQLEKLIDITGDCCGPLLIKELLEFDSPHHSDFMPVYDVLIRYPNGIKS